MHHAVPMAVGDRVAQAQEQLQPLVARQSGGAHEREYVARPRHQFHREPRDLLVAVRLAAGLEEGGDARVVQRRQHLGFVGEAPALGGTAPRLGQQLDRHRAGRLVLFGLPHHAHAAAAEWPYEAKAAESLARCRQERRGGRPFEERAGRRVEPQQFVDLCREAGIGPPQLGEPGRARFGRQADQRLEPLPRAARHRSPSPPSRLRNRARA